MKKEDSTKSVKKKVKLKIDIKKLLKKPLFYVELIQIILSVFLLVTLVSIGVLGLKFLIPISILIIVVDYLILFFLYKKKGKKTRIALSVLSIVISVVYLILSIVLNQVFSSIDNMFKNNSYIEYSVYALKSSSYKKINDIDKRIVGYYVDDKYRDSAMKKLDKKVSVEYVGYSSINELKDALISEEVEAIVTMDSYLELDNSSENDEVTSDEVEDLGEVSESEAKLLERIENFREDVRNIYKFKVKVDNSHKTKKIDLEKGSFAVYVSGQDSYADSVSDVSRSDVNLLMVVNIKSKQILLLSIPRDYYIKISSKGAYDKLTHISLYGSEETMNSLGDLLDISVDYYVKFNFTTFMKAVEYLLPLDVYSDYDFTTSVYDQTIGNSYSFSKGYNHITDGKMALQFVRARKNFAEGDRQRGINQSRFLRAVINKASAPSVLLKYNKILKSMEGTFLTNISNESIQEIAKYVINNNGSFNISSMSLDGSDASRSTYSGGSQALYVMIPNNITIEEAKVAIDAVFNGEVPNIEQDASELADVKDTHTVTSKDIGKTYSYIPSSKPVAIVNDNNSKIEDIDDDEDDKNDGDEESISGEGDNSKTDENDEDDLENSLDKPGTTTTTTPSTNPDVVTPDTDNNSSDEE